MISKANELYLLCLEVEIISVAVGRGYHVALKILSEQSNVLTTVYIYSLFVSNSLISNSPPELQSIFSRQKQGFRSLRNNP